MIGKINMNDKILSLGFYGLLLVVALVGAYIHVVPDTLLIALIGMIAGIQVPSPFQMGVKPNASV